MSQTPPPVTVSVRPTPTDEELAAILAAYRELWPAAVEAEAAQPTSIRWKFSGRWWVQQPGRPNAGHTWR